MKFITYIAEDNCIILENLIETLSEIADVKVTAHSATQAEASRWLTANGIWLSSTCFWKKAAAWAY